jgi:hypothetical protein
MNDQVGKAADDPDAYRNRYPGRHVGERQLAIGNIEEQFHIGRDHKCSVFFEINRESNRIVGWRSEGGEHVCRVTP